MTTIGLSYSLVKISTKCAPALMDTRPSSYALMDSGDLVNRQTEVPHGYR